ncbi:MAG: hypothetical protein WCJ47_01220, partial [Methanomicrobiales archaeon]
VCKGCLKTLEYGYFTDDIRVPGRGVIRSPDWAQIAKKPGNIYEYILKKRDLKPGFFQITDI